jgi:hypothetical protein
MIGLNMNQNTNLCYSRNDEDFNWDDFGSFLDDVKNDYEEPKVGDSYWSAPFRHVQGDDLVNSYTVERILEDMGERANDLLGEVYDDYDPIVSEEACDELEKFLIDWANRHHKLNRYWTIVGKSTEHKFTAEDLA